MENFETRPELDLNFQCDSDPMLTIEIDTESLEEEGIFYHYAPLINLLKNKASSSSVASIYIAEFESVNFGAPCNSIFLSVIGADWYGEILKLYKSINGVRARYSDGLDLSDMTCIFHVEFGNVWEPYESDIWKEVEFQDQLNEKNELEDLLDDEEDDSDYGEDFFDEESPFASLLPEASSSQISSKTPAEAKVGRVRRARADASVKSIQKNIEKTFGLPLGSVKLIRPSGRAFDENSKMIDFRSAWGAE